MDELLTSFTMEKPNRESNPGTHGRHTGTSATLQRRPSPRTTATTRRHALRQLHGTASHAKRWPSSPRLIASGRAPFGLGRRQPCTLSFSRKSRRLPVYLIPQKRTEVPRRKKLTQRPQKQPKARVPPWRPCLQPNALRPDCQSEKPDGPDHQNETGGSDRKSADQKELRRQRSAHRPCAACIG